MVILNFIAEHFCFQKDKLAYDQLWMCELFERGSCIAPKGVNKPFRMLGESHFS